MDNIEKISNYLEKNQIIYSLDDLLLGKLSLPNTLNEDPVKAKKDLDYYSNNITDLLNTYSITDLDHYYIDYETEIDNILNTDSYVPCDLDLEDHIDKLSEAISARLMRYYDILNQ